MARDMDSKMSNSSNIRSILPWPVRYEATLVDSKEKLSLKEEPIPQDKDSYADDVGIPYCAYSADVDVTAPVVYVNSGNPEDYDLLAQKGVDVRGKIALARYSVPYSYRGFKAQTAQKRGVAALLLYSDPADDGFKKGEVFPWGPWGPESHLQRGGIVYDFNLPGDPRTPGWASVPGGRFLPAETAVSMPTVAAAPMSYKDARHLLGEDDWARSAQGVARRICHSHIDLVQAQTSFIS